MKFTRIAAFGCLASLSVAIIASHLLVRHQDNHQVEVNNHQVEVDNHFVTSKDNDTTGLQVVKRTVGAQEVEPELDEEEQLPVEIYLTGEDIELLANVARAEAGNQDIHGMELVACVVLNRLDSDKFPNTVAGVIYDKKNGIQFSSAYDGGMERFPANEESLEAAKLAILQRFNSEILYFRTDHYHNFGEQVFSYRDHYFSK